MQVCDAVYGLVVRQAQAQYEAVVQSCEARRPPLEASIRTDMDQIITSKEHVANKIKGEPSVTSAVSSVDDSLSPFHCPISIKIKKYHTNIFKRMSPPQKNEVVDPSPRN
jgi:hypothetical protein